MSNHKALKSGMWYTISNFLVKGLIFLTTPIFTRLLTSAEFGSFNNYTSWVSIITIFITLNLESTLISARYDFEDNFDGYILSMLALSFFNTIIWSVVINIKGNFFESFFDLDIRYINAMLLYLLFLPVVNMFQIKERYYFEYKKTIIISVVLSLSTTLLSVVLVVILPNRLSARILGSVLPTIVLGGLLFPYFVKNGRNIKIGYWKYALPIALPYIPHLLSMTILNSTDRVMITKMCGPNQTALYSLAYLCGSMVTLLITSLNSAFAPWLGEKIYKDDYLEIRRFSYLYILIFAFISIGIMLVSPEILYILGGTAYMNAVYVLAPVSMGCFCQFLYTLFVNVEQFKKKTGGMALGSVIAASTNFILNLILIPKFGYLAAAYTTLFGYIILLIIHMHLVNKLGLKAIYDYRFIVLITLIGIFIMILIILLYSHTIIRYSVTCIYVLAVSILICKYKNKLLRLLKKEG